jgi:hypothetical protein
MEPQPAPYESGVITFSSEIVPPDALLSTFAVFYDRVWLPYPYGFDPRGRQHSFPLPLPMAFAKTYMELSFRAKQEYLTWLERWQPLEEEGVIKILPPPTLPSNFGAAIRQSLKIGDVRKDPAGNMRLLSPRHLALAVHGLFAEKPGTDFYLAEGHGSLDTTFQRMTGLLTHALLTIRVPQLRALEPVDIVSVRRSLDSTRKDFETVILETVTDLEDRIRRGEVGIDAAGKVAEARLSKLYKDIVKTLESRSRLAGKLKGSESLAAGLGKFLELDFKFTTPKFWVGLLEILLPGAVGVLQSPTTDQQANIFMGRLYSESARLASKPKH